MDSHLLPPFFGTLSPDLIPYAILAFNFVIFQLLRSTVRKLFTYYKEPATISNKQPNQKRKQQQQQLIKQEGLSGKCKFLKLLLDELISTCELCADCAELNVIYEKHGSFMYALSLFILTYFWLDTFGDAHTTPGCVIEDYFLDKGNELFKQGEIYARFLGQSMAMPLAWRFASIYWSYKLLSEHSDMLMNEKCKSSLQTTTLNGFLIECTLGGCCRFFELFGNKLLNDNSFGKRIINITCSFLCTASVVIALELSGGYFNPVLAASLEYGCKGINFYQHVIVFWFGPLFGHLLAKLAFKLISEQQSNNKKSLVTTRKSKSKQSNITYNEQQENALFTSRPTTRSSRKKRE